ncbi:hypothetical protein JCM10212_003077 [Sporobolomyces blumeae]
MRPSLSSFLVALALYASSSVSTAKKTKQNAAENNPDDPTGKILYITEPACGFYRCTVTWSIGEQVAVNWLGPPGGDVSVSLQSNIGGPTYPIVDSIAGTSQEGYCDAGYGVGTVAPGHECGRVEFVVPSGWEKMNNYTIVVQSLSNPDEIGYTDMITIAAGNSTENAPSGTSVSLVTIPAPTTTNYGASTQYTGSIPSPTAGAANAVSSSSASSSASTAAVSSARRDSSSSVASNSQTSSTTSSTSTSVSAAVAGASGSATPASGATTLTVTGGLAIFAASLGIAVLL